jgi:hypothetical protein
MDPACHDLGRGEGILAFLLTLDAVNFGSGNFPAIFTCPEQSGFRTVAPVNALRLDNLLWHRTQTL